MNQALPTASRQLLEQYSESCQNLGLILDKYAPWGQDQRGSWDLVMKEGIRRRGQTRIQTTSGGQAKGLWLSTSRRAGNGESPSLFEVSRTDVDLMREKQRRWQTMIGTSDGIAFQMRLVERMAAGLGASHVLETGLTLDRNTGLPYLPGSTVKGLARAWGLIEVAAQLGVQLPGDDDFHPLNELAEILITAEEAILDTTIIALVNRLQSEPSDEADTYVDYFRFIFGSQQQAGAVSFSDGIYFDQSEPKYMADVMTPHFADYYTNNGKRSPSDDSEPNPVSFLTVAEGNWFAFGLIPRLGIFKQTAVSEEDTLVVARDWLANGLSQLGVGSKTAAGYGFFSRRSFTEIPAT